MNTNVLFKQISIALIVIIGMAAIAILIKQTLPENPESMNTTLIAGFSSIIKPLIALLIVGIISGLFGLLVHNNVIIVITALISAVILSLLINLSIVHIFGSMIVGLSLIYAAWITQREDHLRKSVRIIPLTKSGVKVVVMAFAVLVAITYYTNIAVPQIQRGDILFPSLLTTFEKPLQYSIEKMYPGIPIEKTVGQTVQEMQRAQSIDPSQVNEQWLETLQAMDQNASMLDAMLQIFNTQLISFLEPYKPIIPIVYGFLCFSVVLFVSKFTNIIARGCIWAVMRILMATSFVTIHESQETIETLSLEKHTPIPNNDTTQ